MWLQEWRVLPILIDAIAETLAGNFQGIITAPIAKSCWQAAGYDFPGQTEVLAERAGINQVWHVFCRPLTSYWQFYYEYCLLPLIFL